MIPTSLWLPAFRAACCVRRLLAIVLLLALAATAEAGDSMRCGSRLVAVEARAAELLSICGEPAYRDVWPLWPLAPGDLAEQEEWTYNFGPQQLLRVVRLRNGRIVDIVSEDYGFVEPDPNNRRCAPEQIVEGISKYRLLTVCGAPLTRSVSPLILQVQPGFRPHDWPPRAGVPVVQVFREEWVYDFGPNRFMRVLTLENGRVVRIENGMRGSRQR